MFERLPVDMWVPDAVKQIAGHWIPLQHVSLQEVWHTLVKYFQIMKNPSTIKCIPHSWNCYVVMSAHFLMEFSPSLPIPVGVWEMQMGSKRKS